MQQSLDTNLWGSLRLSHNNRTAAHIAGMPAHMKRNRCPLPAESINVHIKSAGNEMRLLDIYLPKS